MSEQNVGIVLAAFDAYLRGDEDGMLALASPEIVSTQFPDQLDVRDYHGREELRQLMADWVGSWEEWTIGPLSASAEDDRVFVNALQRGRGKGSGAPMEDVVVFVFTVRDGMVARWQMFHDEAEARAAVRPG